MSIHNYGFDLHKSKRDAVAEAVAMAKEAGFVNQTGQVGTYKIEIVDNPDLRESKQFIVRISTGEDNK